MTVSSSKNLTAVLLGKTKKKILEALLDEDESVSQISERLKIIEPGVRRHLGEMEKMGIVDSSFKQNGLGRPKKYYAISPLGRTLFPKMYDLVLSKLVTKLSNTQLEHGENLAERALADVATELATVFRSRAKNQSLDNKLRALEEYLNELGFSSRVSRRKDGQISIVRNDCALYSVAISNCHQICVGFDTRFISECFGEDSQVKLVDCMALGRRTCEHLVSL